MTPRLTIIVPAFNEADRLPAGIERFDAAVADGAIDLDTTEVVLIDDGSTDQTGPVATRLLSPLPHHRVISLPTNGGKGAAVRTGIALARGPYVAYMDADMAIDPRAVPLLLDALGSSEAAIGSRALAHSMVDGTYAVRAVMGRLFNRLVTTGTGLGLEDTQCGFKAFRTPAARLLFHLVAIDRFAFDVEVLARARRLGLRISQVPVHWKNVPGSTVHPLHDSVTMLSDVFRSRYGFLATPPVPAVIVADKSRAGDRAGLGGPLVERVGKVVADSLDGAPVPLVERNSTVTVLLPLVEPVGTATVFSALRAEFNSLDVSRRSLNLDGLAGFGTLAGRLHAATEPPRVE
jgi:glycosyltransferase involved in cell wall biosynthesis